MRSLFRRNTFQHLLLTPLSLLLPTFSLDCYHQATLSKSPKTKTKKESVGKKNYTYSLPSPDRVGVSQCMLFLASWLMSHVVY